MKITLFLLIIITNIFALDKISNDDDEITHKLNLLNKYIKVLNLIEKEYVEEVSYEELINKSINGLVKELDMHSNFLKDDIYKDFKKDFNHFNGYGITTYFDKDNKDLIINEVINKNLDKFLERGNVILSINDKNTRISSKKEVSEEFKKDELKLIYQNNKLEIKTIQIKKEQIENENIIVKNDKNYLYILIRNFVPDLSLEIEKILNTNDLTNKKLIIDLRNNSGGLFLESLNMLDLFLDKDNMMIKQKSRVEKYNQIYYSTGKQLYKNNIIILVNNETASSSEIFASVMKFYNKATIIGEKTYGKGSVQTLINLNENNTEAIKITNSILYLPDDSTFHLKGINPDFIINDKVIKNNIVDNVFNYSIKFVNEIKK